MQLPRRRHVLSRNWAAHGTPAEAKTHRVLSGVVVQVLHEDVHAVHGEVVAILQRRPVLIVSATDANIIGRAAVRASAATLNALGMSSFRIATLRCGSNTALQQGAYQQGQMNLSKVLLVLEDMIVPSQRNLVIGGGGLTCMALVV